MKQRSRVAAILIALLCTLFWVGHANAIIIEFIEPPNEGAGGGVVTINVNLQGLPITFNTNNPAPTAETGSANFIIPGFTLGTPVGPFLLGALIEPGPGTVPILSDIVTVSAFGSPVGAAAATTVRVSFISDTEGVPLIAPPALPGFTPPMILEDGTLQTIINASIPVPGTNISIPVIIRAQSDTEAVVPEPSTLLLVGSGLLAAGAVARRRMRRR